MNKRGTGIMFIAIAAFLHGVRYLTAAIYDPGLSPWSRNDFARMLSYVEPGLAVWATLAFVAGLVYPSFGRNYPRPAKSIGRVWSTWAAT